MNFELEALVTDHKSGTAKTGRDWNMYTFKETFINKTKSWKMFSDLRLSVNTEYVVKGYISESPIAGSQHPVTGRPIYQTNYTATRADVLGSPDVVSDLDKDVDSYKTSMVTDDIPF